jgi:hypothetical protein
MEEDTKTAIWLVVGLIAFAFIMALFHGSGSGRYSTPSQEEAIFEYTQDSQMLY